MTKATLTESQWTEKLTKDLKDRGFLVKAIVGGSLSGRSWPDRMVITPRGTFQIEFKGPKTTFQPGQMNMLAKINRLQPHSGFVVRRKLSEMGGVIFYNSVKVADFDSIEDFWPSFCSYLSQVK